MSDAVMEPKGELVIMDHTGDTKIIWDKGKAAEVDHARDTFDRFKAKGYMAYKVDSKGDKGEVIKSFDPSAEKMILAPATVGG
jgi:hypothetical protein